MTSAIRCYTYCSPHRSPSPEITLKLRRSSIFRCSLNRKVLFNRVAPIYDNLNDLLSLGQHRVWKRMTVSWSGAKQGDRVLDICCGSGDLSFILSEKVGRDGQVIGLDFSGELLEIASFRQKQSSISCYRNIEWMEGNALDLPFPDGCFDAITMGYGLRNVIDRERAMKEVFRVLRPGCRASILDFNKSKQPITTLFQEWMIDNVVAPVASGYGLTEEYKYLKPSIRDYLTGVFYIYYAFVCVLVASPFLYGIEGWAVKKSHVRKIEVTEMRMLHWMCGHIRSERISNDLIWSKLGVASIA